MIRGILCDVFSMIRYDFELYKGQPAIMEYYFMAVSMRFFFRLLVFSAHLSVSGERSVHKV